jgi:hypothetical protein
LAAGKNPSRFLDYVALHHHLHHGMDSVLRWLKVEFPRHFFRSMRTLSCCSFNSFFFWWYLRQWAITVQYWATHLVLSVSQQVINKMSVASTKHHPISTCSGLRTQRVLWPPPHYLYQGFPWPG